MGVPVRTNLWSALIDLIDFEILQKKIANVLKFQNLQNFYLVFAFLRICPSSTTQNKKLI